MDLALVLCMEPGIGKQKLSPSERSHCGDEVLGSDAATRQIVGVLSHAGQGHVPRCRAARAIRPESHVTEFGTLELVHGICEPQANRIARDVATVDAVVRHGVDTDSLGRLCLRNACAPARIEALDRGRHPLDKVMAIVHVAREACACGGQHRGSYSRGAKRSPVLHPKWSLVHKVELHHVWRQTVTLLNKLAFRCEKRALGQAGQGFVRARFRHHRPTMKDQRAQ